MRVPWHLIVIVLALAGVLVFMAWPAFAHDHWINHGDYQDPVYKWRCCGENDYKAYDPANLRPVPGGYRTPLGEIIPASRAIPSEDQYSYICRWGSKVDGSDVRCLFIPQPGT
jgi:hypothetical protein